MNLSSTRTRLETLTKDLLRQWDGTKDCWQDAKSQEFERTYIQELAARVDRTVVVLEKLDTVLTKARQDCE